MTRGIFISILVSLIFSCGQVSVGQNSEEINEYYNQLVRYIKVDSSILNQSENGYANVLFGLGDNGQPADIEILGYTDELFAKALERDIGRVSINNDLDRSKKYQLEVYYFWVGKENEFPSRIYYRRPSNLKAAEYILLPKLDLMMAPKDR